MCSSLEDQHLHLREISDLKNSNFSSFISRITHARDWTIRAEGRCGLLPNYVCHLLLLLLLLGRSAAIARCSLLLQTESMICLMCRCVWLLVTFVSPAKNGWTDRDAVWDGDSGGPKEPCILRGYKFRKGSGNFRGLSGPFKSSDGCSVAAAVAAKRTIQSPIASCSRRDHSVCQASANSILKISGRRRCGLSSNYFDHLWLSRWWSLSSFLQVQNSTALEMHKVANA